MPSFRFIVGFGKNGECYVTYWDSSFDGDTNWQLTESQTVFNWGNTFNA